jgi:hypothetical protein
MSFLDRILCAGLLAVVPCPLAAQGPESDVLGLDSLLKRLLGQFPEPAALPE